MAATVSLFEESKSQGGFYVPRFEVYVEGAGLPGGVLRDIKQLVYKDSIKEIDSFELVVNNWNPSTNAFKYVGSETEASLQQDDMESHLNRLFEPCNKEVKVSMGYGGDLKVMLTGNFTTMEPNFPSSGAPTLNVRGLNALHQFRTKKNTRTWKDKKISQIVKNMESEFLIPIKTDNSAMLKEPFLKFVSQKNLYDMDFILLWARKLGYVVYVQEEDPNVPGSQRQLFFGQSESREGQGLRDVTFQLEWGKSLIDFKPTLTTANQVASVTVKSWNRRTREPIEETVTLEELGQINEGLQDLLGCDSREISVVNERVDTRQEARERAKAILKDRIKEMVIANGTTVGLPDLRSGKKIIIANVGSRFSGTYFVTDTNHTIGDNGYITKFKARREDDGVGL
jgi:phage protein D